jgi:hypothetical protein
MRIAPLLKMLYLSGCSHAIAYSTFDVNHDAKGRTAETAVWYIVLKWIFVDTLKIIASKHWLENKMGRPLPFLILTSLLLTACGGPDNYAGKEDFQSDARYRREYSADFVSLCAAARRVLLGDGYIVMDGEGQKLTAGKEFHIEDKSHAILQVYVSCDQRMNGSTLFITATEEHFDVKTSRKSTLLGVPLVAPISLGTRKEADYQVKIRGETITDRKFYERFYQALQLELAR